LSRAPRLLAVLSVLGLLGGACIPRIPIQRLPTTTPIAVAYVVDPAFAGEPTTAPEKLKAVIAAILAERNLQPVELPLEVVKGGKLTDTRMAAMREADTQTPYLLLVELRVQFFSQLDGRYRWEVGTTLTAERRQGTQVKDPFEVPIVLIYDHEKQDAAMVAASHDIGSRLGVLLDGLLSASATAPTAASAKPGAIYFVMVDRFLNGNHANDADADPSDLSAFHGGDLDGLIDRLDWLQSLGIDTVWLSPIFTMRTEQWHGYGAFHGYWTFDLASLEPRFGTEQTVVKLRQALRTRGMKLVLDLVLNHVGPDAPVIAAHPGWFHRRGGVTDWHDATQLETFDVHGLPDLAQENPEVAASLRAATRRWLRPRPA